MQFKVNQKELYAALSHLSRVVDAKFFPHLKIEVLATDRLKLTAKGNQTMEVVINVIEAKGEPIFTSCKRLYEIIAKAEGMLDFKDDTFFYGKRKGKITLQEITNYEPIVELEGDALEIEADTLIEALKGTMFAAQKFGGVQAGVMSGISINKDEICGTTGYIMGINTLPAPINDETIIMPQDLAQEIIKCFDGETISIITNGVKIHIWSDKIRIVSCLLNGVFPDYWAVIPKKQTNKLLIDKAEILKELDYISTFRNIHTNLVILRFSKNELAIEATSVDNEEGRTVLDVDYLGKPVEIGLNIDFLTNCIKNSRAEVLTFEFSEPLTPVVIKSDEKNLTMVVPMQIRVAKAYVKK